MINKIKQLEKLSRLLDPKESQRKKWNAEVLDYSNTFINNLDASKAFIKSKENGKEIYNLDIEEQSIDLALLLESTTKNIDKKVGIYGIVKNPDMYDLEENMYVEDLLLLSGGFLINSDQKDLTVNRTELDPLNERIIRKFNLQIDKDYLLGLKDRPDNGFILEDKDIVVVNKDRQIATAKRHAIQMLQDGYTQPTPKKVLVYGQQALGMFLVGTDSMEASNFISEHDQKIANKLAYVMAGGDLSEPTLVTEQYLLDIEREAFLILCSERKTLERIEHMLKTGKPLRN